MRNVRLRFVYLVQFIIFFAVFALFLTNFPRTPKWALDVTKLQKFLSLCRSNLPMWIALSALFSAVGTLIFALLRGVISKRNN